jgi:deoxyribonuclease V
MVDSSPDMAANGFAGMDDIERLDREQRRLGSLAPPLWQPPPGPIVVAGVFVAFARAQQGPGRAGDGAFVGAAATRDTMELVRVVVEGRAGAPYRPGYLAAREGALIEAALRTLLASGVAPDVILIDATGRDHPRGAGLALQVGAVFDVPTVGVTHRPLYASGPEPDDVVGATTALTLDGVVVGRWLRLHAGVRPVAVHAAWRTDDRAAIEVVTRVTARARTPEPLRLARMAAREARAGQPS